MTNDRIKLALSMGWKWSLKNIHYKTGEWVNPEGFAYPNWCEYEHLPFNPFTDANDDYDVLEWMREKCGVYLDDDQYEAEDVAHWDKFVSFLPNKTDNGAMYEIGDYARAALKVLE